MTDHPKRPRDPNQLAKSIIDIATGQRVARISDSVIRRPNQDKMTDDAGACHRAALRAAVTVTVHLISRQFSALSP
jgi:hypothetical protein